MNINKRIIDTMTGTRYGEILSVTDEQIDEFIKSLDNNPVKENELVLGTITPLEAAIFFLHEKYCPKNEELLEVYMKKQKEVLNLPNSFFFIQEILSGEIFETDDEKMKELNILAEKINSIIPLHNFYSDEMWKLIRERFPEYKNKTIELRAGGQIVVSEDINIFDEIHNENDDFAHEPFFNFRRGPVGEA